MPDRNKELAKIHIAKSDLGMEDDAYRAMLWTIGRVHSAADLDHAGRARVLDHMAGLGFQPRRKGRPTPAANKEALIKKVYALLGARPVQYAEGILKNMYKGNAPAKLEWASPEQLTKVIAALNYDKNRKGKTQ